MLDLLKEVLLELPALLVDEAPWQDVFVNYHPPFVERVWRQYGDHRIYLHRIHPCAPGEALMHPHPWPSAMVVAYGRYEMLVGFGAGEDKPPVATGLILNRGAMYEMTHVDAWHSVRPLDFPAMSVMVTGKPWDRPSPKSSSALPRLDKEKRSYLIRFFRTWEV